jgi:hypothetical protein
MQTTDFISRQCSLDRKSAAIPRYAAQSARIHSKADIAPRLAGVSAEYTF